MVSTRHHPSAFPDPATPSPSSKAGTPSTSPSSSQILTKPTQSSSARRTSTANLHTPDRITMIWLIASLPLVVWDFMYVFLRPHSMPGGALHSPVWTPYALYGTVDYTYGWPAWQGRVGFTAAQSSLNAAETAMYGFYLWVVWRNGRVGKGEKKGVQWFAWDEKRVDQAGLAVLVAFAGSVMTLSKTVLYVFNEFFSGFDNIGHNSFLSLIPLWIIPNGLWLVFPAYMTYIFGAEILAALGVAGAKKSR
ncbi:MAG: hypothetical protein Q9227_001222 [Pyrenula ochraceoflavens]